MFSRVVFDNFRNDFNKSMEELEKKYGFKIDLGTINYGEVNASAKITITDVEKGVKTGLSPEQTIWNNNCHFFNFKPEDFGKQIKLDNRYFKIIGILPNCRKNGILIQDIITKTEYKTSYEVAKKSLVE